MEKVYRGVQPLIVEIGKGETLRQPICQDLEIGDSLILNDEGSRKQYFLAKKDDATMVFVSADTEKVEEIIYEKYDEGWQYSETEETEVGGTSEAQVKALIQADKDIVSKITKDIQDDVATFAFPIGVMPIKCYIEYFDDYCYFDYFNGYLLNSEGSIVANVNLNEGSQSNYFVEIEINEHLGTTTTIDEVLYFLISNLADVNNFTENWYAILNPQPSGTKLYLHDCALTDSENTIRFKVISSSSTAITISSGAGMSFINLDTDTFISIYSGSMMYALLFGNEGNKSKYMLYKYDFDSSSFIPLSFGSYTITDTVNPL